MYTGKSKSAEFKIGRIIAVEVDSDQLVRTCLVRYCLVQNMTKVEKTSYKGVTVKHIRLFIQQLVVLLPQEEQKNIRPIIQKIFSINFLAKSDNFEQFFFSPIF